MSAPMSPHDSAAPGDGPRFVVRPAAGDEIPAVASLLNEVFAPIAARMPAEIGARYVEEVADVEGRVGSSVLLVAVSEGGVIGTVTFLDDAAADTHPWPAGGCVLRLLAVTPSARGTGVGRALVQGCLDRARELRRSFVGLHTAPIMEGGVRLYQAMGFVRSPAWDFDPADHYTGRGSSGSLRGEAYVFPLD